MVVTLLNRTRLRLFRPGGRTAALLILAVFAGGCEPERLPEPKTRVTIDSIPEQGARVTVGGAQRGPTPVTVEGLPPGETGVLLEKEGYKRTDQVIVVEEGQDQHFVLELRPLVGFLSVDTQPQGAEVFLDGAVSLGTTPVIEKAISHGPHTLDLKKPDYYPFHTDINIEVDFKYDPVYILDPMESTVSVTSRPSAANIWINNEAQPQRTPAKFTLKPGLYIFSVHSEGHVQQDERVDLPPNRELTVTLKMTEGNVPAGMMLVPAGTFQRGADGRAPDESPKREIFLKAFYIDKYEVTNAQYQQVFPKFVFPVGAELLPVTGVSWEQAMAFAAAVEKRLPTELEWERAARGTNGQEFPWGQSFDAKMCNTEESNIRGVVRVGSYLGAMSPAGCLDMAGNAYEWTVSWYDAYPENTSIIQDYGQVYRVLRGGSYMTPQFQARCAMRHFDRMDAKRSDYGFRCARDVAGAAP